MTITINVVDKVNGTVNVPLHITSDIQGASHIEWMCNHGDNFTISMDQKTLNFTPSADGVYVFTITASDGVSSAIKTITVTVGTGVEPTPTPDPVPTPEPNPTPTPAPTGDVLFDSHIQSKLHDSKVRTIKSEGSISPCGNGIECRASGSPEIHVNADGTFSLWDNDLGRFYGYTCNYNATMELECAMWNSGSQTISLKMRSRHNEGGDPVNRFGGYGFAIKAKDWDAKREDYHNVHTSMGSGSLPKPIAVKQYVKIRFTVKDEGTGVRQIGEVDGVKVFDKVDNSTKPYMVDKASFAKQSYYWVRQNTTSLAELRVKSLRILKA